MGRRLNSMAVRLTLWYALLTLALTLTAGGAMYWLLADRLDQEDQSFLASKIAEAQAIMRSHPGDHAALREELQHESETFADIRVRVIDAQGHILADSPQTPSPRVPATALDSERQAGFTAARPWQDRKGMAYLLMSRHVDGYSIEAAMRLAHEKKLLDLFQEALMITVIVVLFSALAAGYAIALYGLQPTRRLALIVDGLGVEQLKRRVSDPAWPEELQQLAQNFDRLLERLDEAFSRISRFSADIAHELRTPLHILRGEAEMALSHARSEEEYRDSLASAMEEYLRLSQMVDALLFLARAEQPDAVLHRRPLDLRDELKSVCDFFQAMAEEKNIQLSVEGHGSAVADATLLRRALCNLVDNALRHTPAGGDVTLRCHAGADGSVELSVCDSGCGIAAEDLPRVSDRFYRVDRVRSRQGGGAGLGLAIVQSIMHLHAGKLLIHSQVGQGSVVTLSFPSSGPVAGSTAPAN